MLQKTNEVALVEAIKKIPLLNGISPSRIRVLISLCEGRALQPGGVLCTAGGISDELYILLVGELGVFTPDDLQVASLKPVSALGIGAITGQPRLAALKALKPTRVLVLRKTQLDRFFNADPPSRSRIYRNFIHILAEKVNNDNTRLRDLQAEQEQYHSRLAILQRQLKVHQQRLHFTLEFVSRRGFMDYTQARRQVDEQRPAARVLLVAGDPQLHQQLREALAGMEVAEAEEGGQALAAVKEELPDLVLTTLPLSGMDGLALLEQLRAYQPQLPVVALVNPEEAEVAEGKGFAAVVGVEAETLRSAVEGLLEREGLA
ncbi:MAG: response regulator [Candidatus Latescibacteria bacterium]|nr:response regulator [Candidatus Latescibacterota bacterium]